MVFLNSIDSFVEAAEKIYEESPNSTRYTMKFCREACQVILRVTDNKTVVSYKVADTADLRRVEKLNALFLHLCSERSYDVDEVVDYNRQQQELQQQLQAEKKQQQQQQKRSQPSGGQGKKKKK
ncbi:Signal recognition particle 9 kDa protein [Diplonema papillatum]|nr:Signal recognition particle 9 kDa protein [Diplonema papillatum]